MPKVRDNDTRRDVTFALDQLDSDRDFTVFPFPAGRNVILSKRAVAFQAQTEPDAVPRFPELAPLSAAA